MTIGICDDEKSTRDLISTYIKSTDASAVIYRFVNGDEVLRFYRQGKRLDILYLDIDLKESPDGMVVAEKLKGRQIKEGIGASALPLIIFITGLPDRMSEAFGVRAFHFLIKPIDKNAFALVYEQAKTAASCAPQLHKNRFLTVNSAGARKTIPLTELCYIESKGRKLVIHTENTITEIYGKFADLQVNLDESFYQIHRSFIVNMNYISDYTRNNIQMSNGESIPMSKYKYKTFIDMYATFLESDLC